MPRSNVWLSFTLVWSDVKSIQRRTEYFRGGSYWFKILPPLMKLEMKNKDNKRKRENIKLEKK